MVKSQYRYAVEIGIFGRVRLSGPITHHYERNNLVSSPQTQPADKRQLLRHTVATIAYRGGKTVNGVPDGFNAFKVNETSRTPEQILAHIGDLFDWALSIASGDQKWHNSTPQEWDAEVTRFFATLEKFDAYLASESDLHCAPEKLFQGPIADALTHVGQLAMLRRMAGAPIKGENYFVAEIEAGRVGADQSGKRFEFD